LRADGHAGDDPGVARLPVEDPDDPAIAEFVGLREQPLRRGRQPAHPGRPVPGHPVAGGPGVFVAEGDVVTERALRAGYRLRAVLVDATRTAPLPDGVPGDTPVYAAAPAILRRITGLGMHRGVLASFERKPLPEPTEVLAGARRVVVLERVSNPTNLGSILRSARGLGVDAMLLDPTCTDPLYRRVARVAMGEGYALPFAWLPALPGGLDVVRGAGFRVVALTPDPTARPLDELAVAPGDRIAVLLGAEGAGLSAATLAAADVCTGIAMRDDVDSLNVGVAAAIAFWALRPRDRVVPGR